MENLSEVLTSDDPWHLVLTKKEQENLAQYQKIFGPQWAYNLNQNAVKFPVVSKPGG